MKSLLDAALVQNGLICDNVGWCSRFNKSSDGVDDVGIGHVNIMEGTGTNKQVDTYHGSSIVYFFIVVDGGRIPFSLSS